jgi:26S proteasome regulatory subunit N12
MLTILPPSSVFIVGSALELGAFHSLRVKDIKAFERYMSQLNVFYRDLA